MEQYEEYLNYLQMKSNNFGDLCVELNKLKGPQKTVEEWRRIFMDWQNSVRRKAREISVHRFCTGGGLPITKYLTEIEEKLLEVTGKLVITGMNVQELGLIQKKIKKPSQKQISIKVLKKRRTSRFIKF